MKVSLEKWAEYGWLKAEPTSRDEIKSLMTIVDRDLKDANVAARQVVFADLSRCSSMSQNLRLVCPV
jgi:hypothetical protein